MNMCICINTCTFNGSKLVMNKSIMKWQQNFMTKPLRDEKQIQ